jgi:hypothetical protein
MSFNLIYLTNKVFQYITAKAFGKIIEINYLCDALKNSIESYVRLPIMGGFEDILLEYL